MNIATKLIGLIADKLFPHIGVRMDFPSQEMMSDFIEAHSELYGELFEFYYLDDCSIRFTCTPTMYAKLCAIKRSFPMLINEVSLVK